MCLTRVILTFNFDYFKVLIQNFQDVCLIGTQILLVIIFFCEVNLYLIFFFFFYLFENLLYIPITGPLPPLFAVLPLQIPPSIALTTSPQ